MSDLNIANPSGAQAIADKASTSVDCAIRSTQRVTNDAFDGMSDGVQTLRQQVAPALDRANDMAQRGVNSVRDSAQQLRDRAMRASDTTVSYIKDEPVKAMLIAAATGAGLMALLRLLARPSQRV